MQIVYISNSIIPSRSANSIHVMKMCQAFVKNGNDVILFAPDNPDIEPEIDDIFKFYGVEKCFKLKKLPWLKVKGKAYIYGLKSAYESWKLKPDLVYGRFLTGCYFSTILKIPTIYESHMPVKESGKINEILFKKLLRKKNLVKVVVISNGLRRYYETCYSMPKSLLSVHHDGADEWLGNDNKTIELGKPDQLQVGYVGHLYPGRGIDIIVELAKKSSWAFFHLIGGMKNDIAYWKKETDGLDNIKFYGFLPPHEADAYRHSCDVLLAPYQNKVSVFGGKSETSEWMSPLKIFEYMAAGKPIICSDIPVLREVLNENIAILCDPEEFGEWSIALKNLKDSKKLRESIGRAALNELKNKYTWTKRASDVLRVGLR